MIVLIIVIVIKNIENQILNIKKIKGGIKLKINFNLINYFK
jgi:hypothetical protein